MKIFLGNKEYSVRKKVNDNNKSISIMLFDKRENYIKSLIAKNYSLDGFVYSAFIDNYPINIAIVDSLKDLNILRGIDYIKKDDLYRIELDISLIKSYR